MADPYDPQPAGDDDLAGFVAEQAARNSAAARHPTIGDRIRQAWAPRPEVTGPDAALTRYRMRLWLAGDTDRSARPSLAEVHSTGYVVVKRAALAAAWACLPARGDEGDPLAPSEREAIVEALERPDGPG